MLDDPLDIPQARPEDTGPPDFRAEFWAGVPDLRPTVPPDRPATLLTCRYLDGRHEWPPPPWCPHVPAEGDGGE